MPYKTLKSAVYDLLTDMTIKNFIEDFNLIFGINKFS